MFERRLKILLGILAAFTLMLLLRAGWLQVVQGAEYQKRAVDTGRRSSYLETFRGRILDYKGRVAAEDAPCIDAAVDYRAIDIDAEESQEWLRAQAKARLTARMFDMLAPGGRLIVANFCPELPDVGMMESFMAWNLIYRDEADMREVAAALPAAEVASQRMYRDAGGHVVYLEVERG